MRIIRICSYYRGTDIPNTVKIRRRCCPDVRKLPTVSKLGRRRARALSLRCAEFQIVPAGNIYKTLESIYGQGRIAALLSDGS